MLMDVRTADLDGIAATRRLLADAPAVKVMILTTFEQDDYIFGAIDAGASGFPLKRTRSEELLSAIHAVAAGDSLLSPSVTRVVLEHRNFERMGTEGGETMRKGVDGGWPALLELFARAAAQGGRS